VSKEKLQTPEETVLDEDATLPTAGTKKEGWTMNSLGNADIRKHGADLSNTTPTSHGILGCEWPGLMVAQRRILRKLEGKGN